MSGHALLTLEFTRHVYARELRPGDVIAFPAAPSTTLTVADVEKTVLSADLTLYALTLDGVYTPVHLPANTPVRPYRMVRTLTLPCLLCRKSVDIELNLPADGEPLSLVCGDHVLNLDETEEAE
jgi:hypothetical protein